MATVAVVATAIALTVIPSAYAATLFSDNFEDGNSSGWSTSGGSWSVTTDGSYVLRQTGTGADAIARGGSSSWTNYTVTARVKPTTFAASNRFVALLGRVSANTSYYYLALESDGKLVLGRRSSGTLTPLTTASLTVATSTWYTLSLTLSGSTLTGSVNGGSALTATDSQYASGQTGFATNYAAGELDDVVVSDAAGPSPTSAGASSSGTASPSASASSTTSAAPSSSSSSGGTCSLPSGEEGWATVDGATTGGCGSSVTVVTVPTQAQLVTEAAKSTPEIIMVSGLITGSGIIDVSPNKSIIGVGASSGLVGLELSIEHAHPANVIVQNMNISKVTASSGDGDAIHIQDADHVWIDHNTLSSDLDHGIDYYDGLIDITHAGDYVTVSWNHVANHFKTSLVGHSDSNAAEDTGHLRVTYHHNWFDATMERSPRVRFGDPVHVYDNYYLNITGSTDYYGVASTENAGVLVEDNVFENVVQACWSASGYADSAAGRLVARDNQLVNSGPCETNGTVASIPYSYHLDAVGTVKALVTAGAGTGHV